MFLRIIAIVFAVSFSSTGSGANSAYEVAFDCTKALWDSNLANMQAKGASLTDADKIEGGC